MCHICGASDHFEPIDSDGRAQDYHGLYDSDQSETSSHASTSDNDRSFDDLGLLNLKTIKISKVNTKT